MTIEAAKLLSGYFPIWGATFDSEGVGILGDHVAAYIPDKDEWRQIQKHDVWMERYREGVSPQSTESLEGPQPPLCLVVIERLEEGEEWIEGLSRLGVSMVWSAEDAVLTLRLFKTGWFLDPKLSEIIFHYDLSNHRLAGCYRQAFLAGVPEAVPLVYNLSIDELAREKGQATPITRVWQLIRRYRQGKPHTSADIAIENFHRSYGYQLSSTQRAAFLFTALDAMLGGMSRQSVGRVPMNSRFLDRVAAALEAIDKTLPYGTVNPREEAEWLNSPSNGGRYIRNAIAHGRPSDAAKEAEENSDRIQSIVRLLLRQFLEFSVKWAAFAPEICGRLNIPYPCTAAAAYNRVLETCAKGSKAVLDLLKFDLSAS